MSDPTSLEPEQPDEPDPYMVLGHLSTTVVHHVINYFSTIVSQAEILKAMIASPSSVVPPEAAGRADAIIKAALDGSNLARGLAEFSRKATAFSAGPDEDEGSVVDLNQLVNERVADQKRRFGSKTQWLVRLSDGVRIRGEESQLRVMLDRLLENAREALPAEGGSVTVATLVDPMGRLALEIHDSGSGMEAEVLEHALDPFFSTKPGHLGLGLVLARGIWRRHRGAFSIETEPGRGTFVRLSYTPSPLHLSQTTGTPARAVDGPR
jgi:two-component system, NtrC family, sensor kinase